MEGKLDLKGHAVHKPYRDSQLFGHCLWLLPLHQRHAVLTHFKPGNLIILELNPKNLVIDLLSILHESTYQIDCVLVNDCTEGVYSSQRSISRLDSPPSRTGQVKGPNVSVRLLIGFLSSDQQELPVAGPYHFVVHPSLRQDRNAQYHFLPLYH